MKTILAVKYNEETEEIDIRFVRGEDFGRIEQELDEKDVKDVLRVIHKLSLKIKDKEKL